MTHSTFSKVVLLCVLSLPLSGWTFAAGEGNGSISSVEKIGWGEFLRAQLSRLHQADDVTANTSVQEDIVQKILTQFDFSALPEVTEEEAHRLQAKVKTTSILGSLRPFNIATATTPLALYYAVMLKFPESVSEKTIEAWIQNPDLPVTYLTLGEALTFVKELNKVSHRNFKLPSDAELEYALRGRDHQGEIIASEFYFGDDEKEVQQHAWIWTNSQDRTHGVHELVGENSHPFGLINALGNVWVMSSEGIIRGASFNSYASFADAEISLAGVAEHPQEDVSFRLAEDLSASVETSPSH